MREFAGDICLHGSRCCSSLEIKPWKRVIGCGGEGYYNRFVSGKTTGKLAEAVRADWVVIEFEDCYDLVHCGLEHLAEELTAE